jgi:hypothetical protein
MIRASLPLSSAPVTIRLVSLASWHTLAQVIAVSSFPPIEGSGQGSRQGLIRASPCSRSPSQALPTGHLQDRQTIVKAQGGPEVPLGDGAFRGAGLGVGWGEAAGLRPLNSRCCPEGQRRSQFES